MKAQKDELSDGLPFDVPAEEETFSEFSLVGLFKLRPRLAWSFMLLMQLKG